jgi:hypothetical protein
LSACLMMTSGEWRHCLGDGDTGRVA